MDRSQTGGPLIFGPCEPKTSSGITCPFEQLSLCPGYVIHALLTRSPLTVRSVTQSHGPFDLHALATPPAFVLSQDQTLRLIYRASPGRPDARARPTDEAVDLACPDPAATETEAFDTRIYLTPAETAAAGKAHTLTATKLFTCQRALGPTDWPGA